MTVLALLLLAHFMADFMQPSALVKMSKRTLWGLVIHSLSYGILTAFFVFPYIHLWWLWSAVLGFLHLFIDCVKYSIHPKIKGGNLYLFLFDQFIHFLSIYIVFYLGNLYSDRSFFGLGFNLLAYILGYIIVTYAGSILIFEFCNTFNCGSEDNEAQAILAFTDRYLGMIERALALTLIVFNPYFLVPYFLVPIAFLPSIFIWIKEWYQKGRSCVLIEFGVSFFLVVTVGLFLRLIK